MSAYACSFTTALPPLFSNTDGKSLLRNKENADNCPSNDAAQGKSVLTITVTKAQFDASTLIGSLHREKTSSSSTNDNDSIRFHLNINFNGRKYSATRSYSRFIKLRKDLINELTDSKILPKHRSGCRRNSASRARNRSHGKNDSSFELVPKLPDSIPDKNAYSSPISSGLCITKAVARFPYGSAASSGFTMVQSLLECYYCPFLERWLKRVMENIDAESSPVFSNFIWEPLRDDDSLPSLQSSFASSVSDSSNSFIEKRHHFSSNSLLSLSSINEINDEFQVSESESDEI